MARFRRMQGMDTLFSMGLDENSQHVLRAAEEANVSARAWVDRMDGVFQQAWESLDISYDRFIRTTEEVHTAASVELFRRSLERGDIYKGTYSGWYCPSCNTFYDDDELVDGALSRSSDAHAGVAGRGKLLLRVEPLSGAAGASHHGSPGFHRAHDAAQ